MQLNHITDADFSSYGRVVDGYQLDEVLNALRKTPVNENVVYVPSEKLLEELPFFNEASEGLYGGMPVQLGWCNGVNTKLNCLEYHRDSEFNLGTEDFILLLARQDEIVDGQLDTEKVKAFFVPAGVLVEVYATTLHYAPCSSKLGQPFRVMVSLPKGTNTDKPASSAHNPEEARLRARNKWLLAHVDSAEAKDGAYVGLSGVNIDISNLIGG